MIETNPLWGWRVVDHVHKVRTPWLHSGSRTSQAERAATFAVRRTDRNKLTRRHTTDGDWVVVHSF